MSSLISATLKLPKGVWLKSLHKLDGLLAHVDDEAFMEKWAQIKQANKERLAHHVQITLGFEVNTKAMFDIQIKVCSILGMLHARTLMLGLYQRLHEYKVRCMISGVFECSLSLSGNSAPDIERSGCGAPLSHAKEHDAPGAQEGQP